MHKEITLLAILEFLVYRVNKCVYHMPVLFNTFNTVLAE